MTDSNEQHDTTHGRAREAGSTGRPARPREGAAVRGPSAAGASAPRTDAAKPLPAHVTQEQPRYRFAPTWSSRAVRRDGRLRPSIRNAIGVEPGGRAPCEDATAGAPRTGQVAVPAGARPADASPPRPGEPGTSGRTDEPAPTVAAAAADAQGAADAARGSFADDAAGAPSAPAGAASASAPPEDGSAADAGARPGGRRRRPSRGTILMGAVASAAVAVGAVLGVGLLTSAARGGSSTPAVVTAAGGVVVAGRPAGSGDASAQSVAAAGQQPPDLDVYVDYSSRDAATFSSVNDLPVHGYVQRGQVRLVVHPVVSDPSAPADAYSIRAGDAALCVAQHAPDAFWAYHLALLANLPTQRSNALSDAELVDLATATGIADENVAACIEQGGYDEWLRESSRELLASGVGPEHLPFDRQPLVVLDGAVYLGRNDNSTEFRGFVDAALGGSH